MQFHLKCLQKAFKKLVLRKMVIKIRMGSELTLELLTILENEDVMFSSRAQGEQLHNTTTCYKQLVCMYKPRATDIFGN